MTTLGGDGYDEKEVIVEDCTVVYARAKWHEWSGGRLFNMRGEGGGSGGDNVIFREGSGVEFCIQWHVVF